MTDNIINVNVTTEKPLKIGVSTPEVSKEVYVARDTSAYNAEIAKQWAISDSLILNEDYSSKYYANKAKDSENSAKNYANAAETAYNNIQDSANSILKDIETARVEAVDNITTVKSESIASVEAKSDEVLSTVNAGIAEINSTKTTILNNIEFVADGEKQEIQELSEETQNKIINLGIDTRANIDLSNLTEAGEKHFLGKSQITNCILEKPKYLDWTYEGGVITLKAGSKLMYPDGFNSDGSRKFSYYTTTKDYIFNPSSPSATSLRWLGISRKQFTLNFGQNMLYVSDTAPTTFPSKYMLWYDTTNNILKYTDDSGATWSTDDGTFPFMTAKTIAGQDGIEYPQNIFDGIGIMDRCIWVADGIKALAPNGRNEDGTLNNKETTSKASVVIPTWVNVSPEGAPMGIGAISGTVTYGALYYVESETEPTSTYTIWYNPVRNEIFYKKSDGTLERAFWATVGFYNATYGGVYANHLSLTNSNSKEAFRAVDYNDFDNLKDEVESIPTPIPSYASGINITFTGLKNYTAPNDGIIMFKMYPYGNRSTLGLTVNGYSIPVDVNGPQDDADTQSASFLVAKGDVVKHTNTTTPRAFTCMFYPFRKGV